MANKRHTGQQEELIPRGHYVRVVDTAYMGTVHYDVPTRKKGVRITTQLRYELYSPLAKVCRRRHRRDVSLSAYLIYGARHIIRY
jgi:hypothetical protein